MLKKRIKLGASILGFMMLAGLAAATDETLGTLATNVTKTFTSLAKLITAGSYIAGLGFSIGAILKFKQHKDNPTQIPVGTPVAMLFIAAALLFLPSILQITGGTLFGKERQVGGPDGCIFKAGGKCD